MPTTARHSIPTLFGLALALLLCPVVSAQMDDPVRMSAEAVQTEVAPGGTVTVNVTVEIDEGYHIYGLPPVHEQTYPTTITIEGPGFASAGPIEGPAPEKHVDETLGGVTVDWFTGTVVFTGRVKALPDAGPGTVELTVNLDYMACTDQFCLDRATLETSVTVAVTDSGAVPGTYVDSVTGAGAGESSGDGEEEEEERKGLGTLLWVAFTLGLGSVAFPCIYPLIPLTVAFFTKHEGSRGSAVARAILFCIGIMVAFTAIGLIVGPALQVLATSMWLNLFLFLLMVVLALSLFGMFDIRLPSSWTDRMQSLGSGAGVLAPLFMGVAFSLASFTCVVGFIGPILANAATDWGSATASMFAYSVGFAVPFFLLALFPMLLSSMPKSGGWMNVIKVMLGFFEVCFAGYYLWRLDLELNTGIGTYPIILSLWIVTIFLAGLYLLGKIRLPHDAPLESLPVPRLLLAIVFFAFGLFLFAGLMEKADLGSDLRGLLPPRPTPEVTAVAGVPPAPPPDDRKFHVGYGSVPWTTDYDHGLAVARKEGKRVLLNFTGIFCTNCREMETGLFKLPEVREELEKLVLIELWTDIPSDAVGRRLRKHTTAEMSKRYRKLRDDKYKTAANPYYALLSPQGKVLAGMGYTRDAGEFAEFLRTGK